MPILSNQDQRDYYQNLLGPQEVREDPTFFETMGSAFGFVIDEELSVSSLLNRQGYDDRNEQIFKMSSEGFDLKPYTDITGEIDYDRISADTGLIRTNRELYDERTEILRKRRAENQDVIERGNGFAQFLGSMGGYMLDPINVATMGIGVGTAYKGMSTLSQALMTGRNTAAIALASESAIQPLVYKHKHDINSPYEFNDALMAIGTTAIGAGLLGGAMGGISGYFRNLSKNASEFVGPPKPTSDIKMQPVFINNYKLDSDGILDVADLTSKLPPVPENYIRLYKGDSPTATFDDVFRRDILKDFKPKKGSGRYWTDDPATADFYREAYDIYGDARLSYVDVTKAQAESIKVDDGYLLDFPKTKLTPEQESINILDRMGTQLAEQKAALPPRIEDKILQEYDNFQAGQYSKLEDTRDANILNLEKDIVKIEKENITLARWIAKEGGLNKERWAREGIDVADMKAMRGGQKPVFRVKGGYDPDMLAERLRESGATEMQMNDAIDLVEDMVRNPKMFRDPTVQRQIDEIEENINALRDDNTVLEEYYGQVIRSNVEKDMELLSQNKSFENAMNKPTIAYDDYVVSQLPPAPKATKTGLQREQLDSEGLASNYDRDIANFEAQEVRRVVVDGKLVDADEYMKSLDDQIEGIESVRVCALG